MTDRRMYCNYSIGLMDMKPLGRKTIRTKDYPDIKPKDDESFARANEVSQDAAAGGRLARRVSCVTKSNWLAVRREYRNMEWGS